MAKNTDSKQATKQQAKQSKDKKDKKPKRNRFKETFGELKKVTWPSFGTVVKQTGIVLAVVAIFLVTLMLYDLGLGKLFELLKTGLSETGSTETASMLASGFKGIAHGVSALWL